MMVVVVALLPSDNAGRWGVTTVVGGGCVGH